MPLGGQWVAHMVVNLHLSIYVFIFISSIVLYWKVITGVYASSHMTQSCSLTRSQGRDWQKKRSEGHRKKNRVQLIDLNTECTEWRAIFCLQPQKKAAPHWWHPAINQTRVCKIQFATARAQCITIDNLMGAWSRCELLGATSLHFRQSHVRSLPMGPSLHFWAVSRWEQFLD